MDGNINVIYKYKLSVIDSQSIEMPLCAKIIHIGLQNGELCLWAIVSTVAKTELKSFVIVGTGHKTDFSDLIHLHTFLGYGDAIVYHLFQKID